MEITFNLPHAFGPETTKVSNAYTLEALLNCLVAINVQFLRENPKTPPLYDSGVRYGRTLIWEPIPALFLPNKRRLWGKYYGPTELGGAQVGDCKSLGPARVAELIISGRRARPVFRFHTRQDSSGYLNFHILVLTDKGYEEDPSRVLGMR